MSFGRICAISQGICRDNSEGIQTWLNQQPISSSYYTQVSVVKIREGNKVKTQLSLIFTLNPEEAWNYKWLGRGNEAINYWKLRFFLRNEKNLDFYSTQDLIKDLNLNEDAQWFQKEVFKDLKKNLPEKLHPCLDSCYYSLSPLIQLNLSVLQFLSYLVKTDQDLRGIAKEHYGIYIANLTNTLDTQNQAKETLTLLFPPSSAAEPSDPIQSFQNCFLTHLLNLEMHWELLELDRSAFLKKIGTIYNDFYNQLIRDYNTHLVEEYLKDKSTHSSFSNQQNQLKSLCTSLREDKNKKNELVMKVELEQISKSIQNKTLLTQSFQKEYHSISLKSKDQKQPVNSSLVPSPSENNSKDPAPDPSEKPVQVSNLPTLEQTIVKQPNYLYKKTQHLEKKILHPLQNLKKPNFEKKPYTPQTIERYLIIQINLKHEALLISKNNSYLNFSNIKLTTKTQLEIRQTLITTVQKFLEKKYSKANHRRSRVDYFMDSLLSTAFEKGWPSYPQLAQICLKTNLEKHWENAKKTSLKPN